MNHNNRESYEKLNRITKSICWNMIPVLSCRSHIVATRSCKEQGPSPIASLQGLEFEEYRRSPYTEQLLNNEFLREYAPNGELIPDPELSKLSQLLLLLAYGGTDITYTQDPVGSQWVLPGRKSDLPGTSGISQRVWTLTAR